MSTSPFFIPTREEGRNSKKLDTAEDFELFSRAGDTTLKIRLPPGRSIYAESGAMIAKKGEIELSAKMGGSFFKAAARKVFASEKFFMQTFHAAEGSKGGEVFLAGEKSGDIAVLELNNDLAWYLHQDGFLAASDSIELSTGRQNTWNGCCSGTGVFLLKVSGKGTVFISTSGGATCIDVPEGEELVVDNGHLIAWPVECAYTIGWASKSITKSFTSGEGIVCKFQGPAKVLVQSQGTVRKQQGKTSPLTSCLTTCFVLFLTVALSIFGAWVEADKDTQQVRTKPRNK